MTIPYPIPDGAHTHACMYSPTANRIEFPRERLESDRKLQFPFPGKEPFDTGDPLMLIEKCEDRENCPAKEYSELDPNYLSLAEVCPTAQDNGCPLFLTAFAENTNKDIGWQEIFEFADSSVLDVILSNFKKLKNKLNPPLKLGHDEKQALVQNSGFPSAGWITALKRKEATNKLMAYFSNVPEVIIKLIESGAYKRISAELYNNYTDPDTKEEFGPTLRAASILGADVPRIKTLEDLVVIYHSDNQPYKILTEEKNMLTPIQKLEETVKGLKKDVKDVLKLTGHLEGEKADEADTVVKSLRAKIVELEAEIKALKAKPVTIEPKKETTELSEKVKSQEAMITQLSESVKTIGSELANANSHILDSKKATFKSVNGKVFTPALIEKAMELMNFAEEDNKVLALIEHMKKLHDDDALFLTEEAQIEEELNDPKVLRLSQDKLHNSVTALAEKDKITYTEAFDRYMLIQKASG